MVRRPLQSTHLLITEIVFFNPVCSLTGLNTHKITLTSPLREALAQVFMSHLHGFCPLEGKPVIRVWPIRTNAHSTT